MDLVTSDSEQANKYSNNPLVELKAWQRFHIRLTALYGGTVFLALSLLGVIFYNTGVNYELEGLQRRLLSTVVSLAASIDPSAITAVPLDEKNMSPFHQMLQKRFAAVATQDSDVETIYILRPTNEPTKLRFLIDYAKDGLMAKPGDLYDARELPIMLKGFAAPAVENELYSDEFGTTLSGYAPIFSPQGQSVALVGIDVKASRLELMRKRVLWIVMSIFGVAALLIGIVSLAVAGSVREPLTRIINASGAIARGELNTRIKMLRNDEFGLVSRHFDQMAEGLEEREFLRETFGRYVSEDVAKTLLDRHNRPKLGGEERVVTVLFSDLRGYSTISEQLPPVQVVEMLNTYLGAMNLLIDAHHGCVIEFFGDGILAVFGAPYHMSDHSEQAVLCAMEMRERLILLNQEWKNSEVSRFLKGCGMDQLGVRIGIHTGRVVAGNLGSPTRMKYAVIGDTVNVAARLETLNKELGTDILVSGEVHAHLPDEIAKNMQAHGQHKVKGREQSVLVYSI